MQTIKLKSTNRKLVETLFLAYLELGFVLIKAYSKKKYLFFGQETFFVEMELSADGYTAKINEAIDREDYEEAGKLTKELEHLQTLKFYNGSQSKTI